MKTLQDLYSEVLKSEELKKEFVEAAKEKKIEEFLKANGCDASAEDLAVFLKEQQTKAGELSDNELDNVAGGGCGEDVLEGVVIAISMTTVGLGCIVTVPVTLAADCIPD